MRNGDRVVLSKEGYFDLIVEKDRDGDYWMISPEGWFHWTKIADIPEEKILEQVEELRNDSINPSELLRKHRTCSYIKERLE